MAAKNNQKFPWHVFLFLLLVSLLPYLGAAFDGSFFLPEESLGIFEHYGNICFTIIFPLIFICYIRGIRNFDRFVEEININLVEDKREEKIKIREFLRAHWDKKSYIPLKFFCISCGFIFATINAINTLEPEKVWRHDVYDSINHIGGYVAQRIFFYLWWAYLLPVFVYHLIVIVIILNRLFRLIIDANLLRLQPMHPDCAGGLGRLGRMSLNFNVAILLSMAVSAALYYTHGYNLPLLYGIVVQFLLLPVVFFLPLLRVHKAMELKKESLLLDISNCYRHLSDSLIRKIAKGDSPAKAEYEEELRLRGLYKAFENIPAWPFDVKTIMKFISTFLLPALLWLIEWLKIFLRAA
jgi:hypothetical protein